MYLKIGDPDVCCGGEWVDSSLRAIGASKFEIGCGKFCNS